MHRYEVGLNLQKMRGKVEGLRREGIGYLRRTRGDGNCFYRAAGYGYLEHVVKQGTAHIESLLKL